MKYLFLTIFILSSLFVSYADSSNMSTPENTIMIYDKAWMEMDIDGIKRCLTENAKKDFDSKHLDGLSSQQIEEWRKVMLRILEFSKHAKHVVIEKKHVSDKELHLRYKREFYDPTFTTKYEEKNSLFIFKLEDNEWKIDSQTAEDQKK